MEKFDLVKLISPFKDLDVGTKGAISAKCGQNEYEVTFFDNVGEIIDTYTVPEIYLEVTHKYSDFDIRTCKWRK